MFRFIDLFSGIGGFRMGAESAGGECVFSSECDKFSRKTYLDNFDCQHPFIGDIALHDINSIPDHEILLAGFPCQPFSSAGKQLGFEHATQGTLFFNVANILAVKQPKAFILENVKNLIHHNKGDTFNTILQVLRDELKYHVHYKVIDGVAFVPQHRRRVFIVGFKDKKDFLWDIKYPDKQITLESILHKEDGSEPYVPMDGYKYFNNNTNSVNNKYILSTKLLAFLKAHKAKHEAKGNSWGYKLVTNKDVSSTLTARYHKDGSDILISRGDQKLPRKLTPRECARLMGFPDTFNIPVSDAQAYRQFGNSVIVPLVAEICRITAAHISNP